MKEGRTRDLTVSKNFATFADMQSRVYRFIPQLVILLVAAVLLSGCGKNEFSISGTLKEAGARKLTVVYTALSKKQDQLVTQQVDCRNDAFSLLCATKEPTLVWIMGPDGTLLHVLYAEKGNKIQISGNYNSPLEWKITGNKVSERYADWMRSNVSLLTKDDPSAVNGAVAKYVKENPKDMASAVMLLTFYHRNTDEKGFNSLWASLKISDKDKTRLLHTAMTQLDNSREKAAALTVGPLTLRARGDSIVTVSPATARATILYFWRRTDGPHKGFLRVLASQPSDVQTADVYLEPDSVQWRYNIQNDTIRPRTPLWAFGGEMNLSLRRLAIPETPYFIVTDRNGKQLYRGTSASDAAAAATP